jgi:hypothetical protein
MNLFGRRGGGFAFQSYYSLKSVAASLRHARMRDLLTAERRSIKLRGLWPSPI